MLKRPCGIGGEVEGERGRPYESTSLEYTLLLDGIASRDYLGSLVLDLVLGLDIKLSYWATPVACG